jgi:dihydroflavonol-4-reductase
MKKVLVTGANGFIGSHLVEILLRENYRVRCLVRKTSDLCWIANLDVEFVYGDLEDQYSLLAALKDVDLVFHLAGKTKALGEEAFRRGNVAGTRNLLEVIDAHRLPIQRFVYVSSQAAVGSSHGLKPVTEDDLPRPLTRYGRSKLAAEDVVRRYASRIPVTIVRPPSVFGPRDTDMFEAFRAVHFGVQPVLGWRERRASLIYVEDLARGLILAAESRVSEGRVYHIVTEPDPTWKDFTAEIAGIAGKRGIRFHIPLSVFAAVCLVRDGIARLTRKPSILNWDKIKDFSANSLISAQPSKRRTNGMLKRDGYKLKHSRYPAIVKLTRLTNMVSGQGLAVRRRTPPICGGEKIIC